MQLRNAASGRGQVERHTGRLSHPPKKGGALPPIPLHDAIRRGLHERHGCRRASCRHGRPTTILWRCPRPNFAIR
jgi:hypothetical protein